jgi:hypothetical protein
MAIRRFDVFAEYNRQKAIADGLAPDEAKGYGLWLAKVVAARRFGRSLLSQPPSKVRESAPREPEEAVGEHEKWRTLSGEPQTDELFEKEIVRRMGREFYDTIFVPAIQEAVRKGDSYEAIRDVIRREWKP